MSEALGAAAQASFSARGMSALLGMVVFVGSWTCAYWWYRRRLREYLNKVESNGVPDSRDHEV